MTSKMKFEKLDDTPMLRQQINSLAENAELLRGRCYKLYKGCRKYTDGLGEGFNGVLAFATAIDSFGGDPNDHDFVAIGGPVLTSFSIALREIGMYKETLQSQVDNVLGDKLLQFLNVYLHDVKEARKRFDKASIIHDQARDKFLSLRKSSRLDTAVVIEQELKNAKTAFDEARFNLLGALSDIEAKKRFEFLEVVSGMMDAHLSYFKRGYELLHQMEPHINQILCYAQQSRETSNHEQVSLIERMVEYKKHTDPECKEGLNGGEGSNSVQQVIGLRSNKEIETVMQSSTHGKVQTIRQGYLLKRSSNLRGDWKRRFFVLDSKGTLYYYRKGWHATGNQASSPHRKATYENSQGLLSRLLSPHSGQDDAPHHTVNLLTSTIKIDADQTDLRFCFRIVSPSKTYTLQAENTIDQMDWIDKITAVIASLLSFQGPPPERVQVTDHHEPPTTRSGSREIVDEKVVVVNEEEHSTFRTLSKVSGNDKCADCGAPEPDWVSLNLGVLICIECSGVHRNLGVQISKVRSLSLDVKVWDSYVVGMLESLGNAFTNTIWEELLRSKTRLGQSQSQSQSQSDEGVSSSNSKVVVHKIKPSHDDHISLKEIFIYAKYSEKAFIRQNNNEEEEELWKGVYMNDKKAVYGCIVRSGVDHVVNTSRRRSSDTSKEDEDEEEGCGVIHVACQRGDTAMVELLLQHGANMNAGDAKGRGALHYAAIGNKAEIAEMLIRRGANPKAKDKDGNTALDLLLLSTSASASPFAHIASFISLLEHLQPC